MKINAIEEELNRTLDEMDAELDYLANSPRRVFKLVEPNTLTLFHSFNLCFKQFWDAFDRQSASQLLLYQKFLKKHSELTDRYVSLFREQIDYSSFAS